MQRIDNDSSTYRKAAAASLRMENGWTNAELSSQPHAPDMHAGAGGAPNPVTHTFGHHPENSQTFKYTASNQGLIFSCSFPGCYADFFYQDLLHEHAKVHSNALWYRFTNSPTSSGYGIPQYGMASSHDDSPNAPGFHGDLPSYPSNPSMSAPTATVLPVLMPESDAYMGVGNTAAGGSPYPTASLKTNTLPSTPTGTTKTRYPCSFPGCNTTCARQADLRRHLLKHGPRQWDCPAPGCSRKGANGFARKDKLVDHYKLCSERAGRGDL
ncbi:MAG: hypothetical protein Q9182_004475 [Xanthomendoza sp. 2 TL-2023]